MTASAYQQSQSPGQSSTQSIDPLIVDQAIQWMVRLLSGTATSEAFANCEQWRNQHPQHEQAWQQLQTINGRLQTLPKVLAHATLSGNLGKKANGRRTAFKALAMVLVTFTMVLTGYQFAPWQQILADHGTGIGVQRTIALSDGTQMMLNTDSAVDIRFDDKQRLAKLLKGEILVTTGHEATTPYRPFIVQTSQGKIRALGTRFLVRQQAGATLVAVYEGAVEIRPYDSSRITRINAGQQLTFTGADSGAVTPTDPDSAAWIDGVIVAKNTRLADFAAELERYRPGRILCDPAVADITISGVFPLADTDQVIATLQQTLPITAEQRTRYWTTLRKSN